MIFFPPVESFSKGGKTGKQERKFFPSVLVPNIRPISPFNQAPTDISLGPDPSWSSCLAQEYGLQRNAAQ